MYLEVAGDLLVFKGLTPLRVSDANASETMCLELKGQKIIIEKINFNIKKTINKLSNMSKIICIGGNIGSGKTTLIEELAKEGYAIIREDINLWQPIFNNSLNNPDKWYFISQVNIMLTQYEQYKKSKKILPDDCCLIVERTPECCLFFSEVARKIGLLSYDELDVIHKLYNTIKWEPSLYLFLNTPIQTCLERIGRRGRPFEAKITAEYLTALDSYFGSKPAIFLDGTLSSEEICEKVKEHLTTFNFNHDAI